MSSANETPTNVVAMTQKEPEFEIADDQFMKDLKKLRDLRSFLIEQAVQLKSESGALHFEELNRLRSPMTLKGGRYPTPQEWEALENLTQELFGRLNDPLRRRFLYSRIPGWVPLLVMMLGGLALLSLVMCTFPIAKERSLLMPLYMFWLASLGAIGSIAFVGMNALAVQDDATFDISNSKLLTLRIALGALFGVVLTLPFGFNGFQVFIDSFVNSASKSSAPNFSPESALLLLPFALGFSTSLVIMVLNQFVDAIQSFFGKKGSSTSSSANPPSTPTQSVP